MYQIDCWTFGWYSSPVWRKRISVVGRLYQKLYSNGISIAGIQSGCAWPYRRIVGVSYASRFAAILNCWIRQHRTVVGCHVSHGRLEQGYRCKFIFWPSLACFTETNKKRFSFCCFYEYCWNRKGLKYLTTRRLEYSIRWCFTHRRWHL